MAATYEQPPPYDLTIQSDLEFLAMMKRRGSPWANWGGNKPQRMAASRNQRRRDFLLLQEMEHELRPVSDDDFDFPIDDDDLTEPENMRKELLRNLDGKYGDPNKVTVSEHSRADVEFRSKDSKIEFSREVFLWNKARHDHLYITDRGKDIGKVLMQNHLRIYEGIGVSLITLDAVHIGKYAWAKYGFTPDPESEDSDYLENTFNKLFEMAGGNENLINPAIPTHAAHLAAITIKPHQMEEFKDTCDTHLNADHPWDRAEKKKWFVLSDGTFLLGKYVMLEEADGWFGKCDLPKEDGGIMKDYIGYTG